MPVLDSAQLLIHDALFRAGEVPGASEWDAKAVEYLNREYRALCSGACEFLPEFITDWWWMRANGILTINPVITGLADVTQDSDVVTLSVPVTPSIEGRRFIIDNHSDNFIIAVHTAGNTAVTLDSPYTGPTGTLMAYTAMQTTYQLSASVDHLLSPIASFRDNPQIYGLTPERMDQLFPTSDLRAGIPTAFCLENEQTIRFSSGGRTDGVSMRMEYRYRPVVTDLVNSLSSYPLVPLQYRHVLADMVLVYLYLDKNDDRGTFIGTSVRSQLGAMAASNRRRLVKIDQHVGFIHPRSGRGNPIRTAGGLYFR